MKPILTPEEKATFRRKLLYARWLYQKGMVDAQSHDGLSHLTAMMHFHNAIEIVLHNIALAYGWLPIAQLRTLKFEQVLNAVDNKGNGGPVTPLVSHRTQVLRLADMRNSIMHHGQRYHRDEVYEAHNTCRVFLKDAVLDFLEEDINQMSMADLIENSYVYDLLLLAESHHIKGEYEKAVSICAVVVYLAQKAFAIGVNPKSLDIRSEVGSAIFFSGLEGPYLEKAFDRIGQLIDKVYENQYQGLFLASDVDVDIAARFSELGYCAYGITGKISAEEHIRLSRPTGSSVAYSDSSTAITFASDATLKVQSMGLGEFMTRKLVWQPGFIGCKEEFAVDIPSELDEKYAVKPRTQET